MQIFITICLVIGAMLAICTTSVVIHEEALECCSREHATKNLNERLRRKMANEMAEEILAKNMLKEDAKESSS